MHKRKIGFLLSIILFSSICSSCDICSVETVDGKEIKDYNPIVYPTTSHNDINNIVTNPNNHKTSAIVRNETTNESTIIIPKEENTTRYSNYSTTFISKERNIEEEISQKDSIETESVIQTTEISNIEEVQTEPQATQEEKHNEEKNENMQDCVILNDQKIDIIRAPGNQSNVDKYDVVQDTQYYSTDKDIYLFGHVYYSFFWLSYVEVGDKVILFNDGVGTNYTVIRNEVGLMTEDLTDVIGEEDGDSLILGDFNCETLRMMTCLSGASTKYRRVVICQKD